MQAMAVFVLQAKIANNVRMFRKRAVVIVSISILVVLAALRTDAQGFVTTSGGAFYADGAEYKFIGANYWYGSLIGLERDRKRGIERLRKELDFLKRQGVTNLRLLGGVEGSGPINDVTRVGPPLQPRQGEFDERVLDGLDLVLYEMGKRRMKAVIFLSNNWEWSGGFQQYLIWNKVVSESLLTRKPDWDELRDVVAKFYSCDACKAGYRKQAELIIKRKNRFSGKNYVDDPTIMAWEIANEPRPMRPFANDDYKLWLSQTSAMIKSLDRRHLVTVGHEGWIGTQDLKLFETVHADTNVDYLTVHIWPKNWGWFAAGKMEAEYPAIAAESEKYIAENAAVAERLAKPLVIEEFGLPRDGQSFDPSSKTTARDAYFGLILAKVGRGVVKGANFWAFGGSARPRSGQVFWRTGDEYMGDPPMEEQGLNTVFDGDRTTWQVIRKYAGLLKASR